jgi:hypothetical protein
MISGVAPNKRWMARSIVTDYYGRFTGRTTMDSAKSDAETLMNAMLPFAEKMLSEHSEFFPYAGAMTLDGKIVNVAGYDGREQPPSADIIELLNNELRKDADAGQYKATAVVSDVRVVPPGKTAKTDAIAIALDHRDNYSVVVLFPYSLAGAVLTLGEPFARKGDNRMFR